MGLLFADSAGGGDFKTKAEAAWLAELGCKACPLNTTGGKVDATGSAEPEIYVLGDSLERSEEDARQHFDNNAGDLLRRLIPREALRLIRWNTVINCHSPKNRTPSPQEIACCRPRVLKDMTRADPRAIWGFGPAPLHWVSGFSGIDNWRGRRMPVKIAGRSYWYYAFQHPSHLLKIARDYGKEFGSEDERMTAFDLQRAFRDIDEELLGEPIVHTPEMARADVECITDIDHISKALQWAARQPYIGFDWETNRTRPYAEGAKILSLGVGTLEKAFSFPIHHPGAGYSKKQVAEVEELIRRFLMHAPCVKRVHNLAFELEWAGYFFGEAVIRERPWEDTANMAAVLDERTSKKMKDGPFSLKFLVQQFFGFDLKGLSNLDTAKLEVAPLGAVLLYNGMDSKYHWGIGEQLSAEIKYEGLEFVNKLAQRRVPTVVLSQLKGVPVDQAVVTVLQKKYAKKVDDVMAEIGSLSVVKKFERLRGRAFNPNSPKDLPYVFDEMLRCDEVWVKDKGKEKLSTDETVLDAIIASHDPDSDAARLAQVMITLREVSGTKSKYIDALKIGDLACVVFPDGLIHTNFNTFFARTSRLSSDEPNLQNFPYRDDNTREVRRSIAAKPGDIILKFDYGQIEARVIAMCTKDPVFVKALWEKFDVHQDWAERLAWAYPARVGGKRMLESYKAKTKEGLKVMKDFRTDIKNQWTFPLFFGARDQSVANYLQIPVEIIEMQVREFWKMFPETKKWQQGLIRFYEEYGYVECLTGRRRRGPISPNQLINAPVQGTAAEIVLDAMSRLSETRDPELQPEINIHDDLTWLRVPEKRADDIAEKIIDRMLAVPFDWVNVPIAVEMSVGKNWCDLEELKDGSGKSISVYSSDTWEFAA